MVEESDGIQDALEGQLRVLITAAGQVAERVTRAREDALRRTRAGSEHEARAVQSRLAAAQAAARVELGNVHRPEWWEQASPDQIGHTYQVARAWATDDPEAGRAEQRIRDELRTRYDIDANTTGAAPSVVRGAVEQAGQDPGRHQAVENAEAHLLMTQAGNEDRRAAGTAAETEHTIYDSVERRAATARSLQAQGIDPDAVATRMHADTSQATPATEAVKTAGKNPASPMARKTPSRGTQVQPASLDR